MAKIKREQVNGIIIVDKPEGETSNRILQKVRYMFNAKKAGHGGCLDPLATGVLPICFGEATKFASFMLDADKRYLVSMQLGASTTTQDSTGEIVETAEVPSLKDSEIKKLLFSFEGKSWQIPSMYSALKHNGQPLYKLARAGIEVERKAREIYIYSITFHKYNPIEKVLTFEAHCSKGTYIRSLVHDLGIKIGCMAHMTKLRRLSAGDYKIDASLSLNDLARYATDDRIAKKYFEDLLLPVDYTLSSLPKICMLDESMTQHLLCGGQIYDFSIPEKGFVRLYDHTKKIFLGLGESIGGGYAKPKRLVCTETDTREKSIV